MSKRYIRLGVNIDHVATVRNARGGSSPCPIRAAELAKSAGADGITAHLREDRRHIKDTDIYALKQLDIPLNFEMAATDEMLKIALDVMPNACCLVPEKREELTTEGGLDIINNIEYLKDFATQLGKKNIRTSLFIDPDCKQLDAAAKIGADIVELHTGKYCDAEDKIQQEAELQRIITAAKYAEELGIECHAGHGLCYDTVISIAQIPQIIELNIGHFLIGESIFVGLDAAIKKMKDLMEDY